MIRLPAFVFLIFISTTARAENGKELYIKNCAHCHGLEGEGTKKHKPPLVGDRSVQQLSKYVRESMPESDPGSLKAAEAEAISAYMHDAFYSPIARERNRPARVELSRLTVKQYRNVTADLVQSFRSNNKWDDKRGLKAEYFKGRGIGQQKAFDRIDPLVQFDWGKDPPDKEKMTDPYVFSIAWNGSFLAPETGLFEFAVRTEHGTRLFINDTKKPLIDAWVKSGKETEFRGSIYLVAGRIYPIKLEFTKANQGVNDPKKQTEKPVTPASIALLWKPPHGVLDVIPSRALSPVPFPEQYICSTNFPPDDRSLGWERGTSVSKEWDDATTDGALELAAYIWFKINDLAKTADNAGDRPAKLKAFALAFTEKAYRRPLNADQKALVEKQFDGAKDLETAVKKAVLLALKSPRFLYREFGTESDAHSTANRLAFGLWDSMPDQPLFDAAAKGNLNTPEQVRTQANRMAQDARAKAKLKGFFEQWLMLERAGELAKDPKRFPGFDASMVADLRTSLDLAVEETTDFRKLLTGDDVYLNGKLAKFYGVDLPADADFQKVTMDEGQRAGILTHPFLMSSFAYTGESSPIHRGVFLTRGLLGLSMKPPPEAVTPFTPNLHPGLNTRERVSLQTKGQACMTCHGVINELGFTLEHFDAVGKFREKDNSKPVITTGSYLTRDGKTVPFKGAVELGKFLSESKEVHESFVEQIFHHVAQQPIRAYGPAAQAKLVAEFAKAGYSIPAVFTEAAITMALGPPKK